MKSAAQQHCGTNNPPTNTLAEYLSSGDTVGKQVAFHAPNPCSVPHLYALSRRPHLVVDRPAAAAAAVILHYPHHWELA